MVLSLADSARKLKPPRPRRGRVGGWAVLMTDQALDDPATALAALPRGGLLVVRARQGAEHGNLVRLLAGQARRQGVTLAVSARWRLVTGLVGRGAAVGVHLPQEVARRGPEVALRLWRQQHRRRGLGILTVACHDRAALGRAQALRADAAFLSPVYPTQSHPGARSLGAVRAALLARRAGLPVVALGGISPRRAAAVRGQGFAGFAAVRGWINGRQSR